MRVWARVSVRLIGMQIRVEGEPPPRASLLVANHLSYVDVVALLASAPGTFVAKTEIASWPGIGALCHFVGTVFVDRRRLRGVLPAIDDMVRTLRAGERVILFPEGTSTPGESVLRFRSALFEAALRAEAPVACASLAYATEGGENPAALAVCWWADMTFGTHAWQLLRLPGFDARISFSSKLLSGFDRKVLARDAQRTIATHVARHPRMPTPMISEVQRETAQCVELLEQLDGLLSELEPERFRCGVPGFEHGTVGDQVRHVLETFDCLIRGVRARRIDYDRRPRAQQLARHSAEARVRLSRILESVRSELVFLPSLELQVRLEAPAAGRDEAWLASNLSRELAFLGSHAVHHFAIVALILRLQGVEVPRYFGVSLSTQATWQRSALTSPSTSSLWASS